MSGRVGVSVEFLSQLSHAAKIGGTDISTMETAVRRMQKTAMDASRGLSTANAAFDQLGINATDSNGQLKTTEQLFMETAEALSKVENNTQKAALATMLYGRAGTSLLPMLKGGKEGLLGVMNEAKKLGIVMSTEDAKAAANLTDLWTKFTSVLKMAVFQIGSALAPVMSTVVTRAREVAQTVSSWIKENKTLIVTVFKIGVGLAAAGAAAVVLGTAIMGVGAVCGAVAASIAAISTVVGVATTVFSALLTPIGLVAAAVVGVGAYFLTTSGAIGKAVDWLKGVFGTLKEDALSAFQGISDALAAGNISLAAKILWAALQVTWQRGVNAIKAIFGDMIKSAIEKFPGLESVIVGTAATFIGVWEGVKAFFGSIVQNIIGCLKEIKNFGMAVGAAIQAVWNSVMSGDFSGALGKGASAFTKTLAEQEDVKAPNAFKAAKDAYVSSSKQFIGDVTSKGGLAGYIDAGQADDAGKLQGLIDNLNELKQQAKEERAIGAGQKPLGEGGKQPQFAPPPTAASIGGTAVGTFSAYQSQLMGGGSNIQERILEQSKKQTEFQRGIKEFSEKLLRETRNNRLVASF